VKPAALSPSDAALVASESAGWVDAHDIVPLWPGKFPREKLVEIRTMMGGGSEFARAYGNRTRDDTSARVKDEWIRAAKARARELDYDRPQARWERGGAFTGVDLAASRRKGSDLCSVFTFAVLADNRRLVLDVNSGRMGGRALIELVRSHHDRFESIVRIETNAFQDYLRQWSLELDATLRVRSHETSARNKRNPLFGVESLLVELENGAWLIPADERGRCAPGVQTFVDDLLAYTPNAHTGDTLMAAWMAREQARASGMLRAGRDYYGTSAAESIAAQIAER